MSTVSKTAADTGELIRALRLSDRMHDNLVEISLTELYRHSTEFYKSLHTSPLEVLPELQKELHLLFSRDIEILFTDQMLPGALRTPHELSSTDFACFLTLEGVVRRVEPPRPVVSRLCFADEKLQIQEEKFTDALTNLAQPGAQFYATTQTAGERLYGLSAFDSVQRIYVQDAPEDLRFTMPASLMCVLQNKLTDAVRPGDRVRIQGVYLPAPHQTVGGAKTVTTRGYFLAFGVNRVSQLCKEVRFETEIDAMLSALGPHALQFLAYSFSPSIFGLHVPKKAILLELLSGTSRVSGPTRIRADINIYLTGAAGCGKSELLKFAQRLARVSTASTGRGTSAAGLTAGVINGAVEAGAMVLADGGICCVDEFDKLLMEDRAAVHEAMEQQTVSIHKAGAHVELNARCAMLAAGNLAYGDWDDDLGLTENLNMPESLISRFDLIFLVEDKRTHDHEIAAQVFQNRYGGETQEADLSATRGTEVELFANIPLGSFIQFQSTFEKEFEEMRAKLKTVQHLTKQRFLLNQDFLREVIESCKHKQPVLTETSAKLVATLYAEMRLNSITKNIIVTARALESLIRLATARAKLNSGDASGVVTPENVEEAYLIIRNSVFGESEAQARRELKEIKNVDNVKGYISELFTEFCLEQEESFPVSKFEAHCISILGNIGVRITSEDFENAFKQVQGTVQGVYVENGIVYM